MSRKDQMIKFLNDKNRTMRQGIALIKDLDSKHTTYFRQNDNAKIGSMPFNLLQGRIKRQIRLMIQNKETVPEVVVPGDIKKTEEAKKKESDLKDLTEKTKRIISQAKAAWTRAEKEKKKRKKPKR